MASSFPTSYDALTNPTAGSLLTSPSHADQHINANDILEAVEQRVGLSGSSFPGSPSSGQFFHRTDRRLDYYYDGTRWLTTTYSQVDGMNTIALQPIAATGSAHMPVPEAGVFDLWLVDFALTFYVDGGTALSASHKWVVACLKLPASSTIATANIDSGASTVWRRSGPIAINALLGTTNFAFGITVTKTGTPGNLYFLPTVSYRLVG